MCRGKAEGGRRCATHLKQLHRSDLLPASTAALPALGWADSAADDPAILFATYPRPVAKAALNAALAASRAEATMTAQLVSAVAGTGAALRGLEYRLKAPASLARKIKTKAQAKELPEEAVADSLDDTIRYTVTTVKPKKLIPVLTSIFGQLAEMGWTVTTFEHSFVPEHPYKGIHLVLTGPTGHRCEVQFHTDRALAVKEAGHGDYDLYRNPDMSADARRAAYGRCVRQWSQVPTPPGLANLTQLAGVAVAVKSYTLNLGSEV